MSLCASERDFNGSTFKWLFVRFYVGYGVLPTTIIPRQKRSNNTRLIAVDHQHMCVCFIKTPPKRKMLFMNEIRFIKD